MGTLDPASYHPATSLTAKITRHLTQWKAAAPLPRTPARPMVTFSFDDFPISAAENGAGILDSFGAKGTFYACTGLAGMDTPLGKMFTSDTLETLQAGGHQIAAHSHAHIDCSVANVQTIQADLATNLAELRYYMTETKPCHYAWPFGETHPEAKAEMKPFLSTARGALPGINRKGTDRTQLRAYEVNRDEWTVERAEQALEKAARGGGWVIIFTHDVQKRPSKLGTTPDTLGYLVKLAHDAGLDILSMEQAHKALAAEMSLD